MNRKILFAATLIMALVTTGCLLVPNVYPPVDSMAEVSQQDVMLVGYFTFNPPLTGKQKIIFHPLKVKGVVALYFDDDPASHAGNRPEVYADVNEGKRFYIKAPKKSTSITSALMVMHSDNSRRENLTLPLGLNVKVKPGDRAIYIGDITVYLDEFYDVSRIRVRDNYSKAKKNFQKKFGKKAKLKKSLVRKMKKG